MNIVGDKLYIADFVDHEVRYLVYADPELEELLHSLARIKKGEGSSSVLGHYLFPAFNNDGSMHDVFSGERFTLGEASDEEIEEFIVEWDDEVSIALHNWLADLQSDHLIQLPIEHYERIRRSVEKNQRVPA